MFGRKQNNEKSGQTKSVSSSNTKSSSSNSACVIVKGTVIEGKFYSKSDTRLDGTINGEVKCDARLIMGPEAKIDGNVESEGATITGLFTGDLSVKGLLSLGSTAKITGNIKAGKIEIEEGAVLNGDIAVGNK